MLRGDGRKYIIEKVKAPLLKVIISLAKRLPEPSKENTLHPNSQKLLEIRERFFNCEENPGRRELFDAIWKIAIVEYEHDPYYRYRIDWVLEQIFASDWSPRPVGHPLVYWKEPGNYGGE